MDEKKDNIYANKMVQVNDFSFDQTVVEVFDDMLSRSIPGYGAVLHQIGAMAKRFVMPNTNIYDLGCSLGAATFSVRSCVDAVGCRIFAVDSSREMMDRFERRLKRHVGVIPVSVECADISDIIIENASLVIMNFTLQFIDTEQKSSILKQIYNGLQPGGAFLFSEKIVFEDAEEQVVQESLYYDLKRHNGYNDLEISQKRDALENVLKLESPTRHQQRLKAAGFSEIYQWYRNLNFASFLAVK
ncbi:MAG: carboxy-S-adenosyl-L-methionine synthase CmoA [Deltaproteobacteria bacterium]|nr:carboxy-S-adenosyl-L-methionine synthase CmoA [Deltaproteobacteria bacterium]